MALNARETRLIQAALLSLNKAVDDGQDLSYAAAFINPRELNVTPFSNELEDLIDKLDRTADITIPAPSARSGIHERLLGMSQCDSFYDPQFAKGIAAIQAALGLPDGDATGQFFAGIQDREWRAFTQHERLQLLQKYVELELAHSFASLARSVAAGPEHPPASLQSRPVSQGRTPFQPTL